MASLAELGSALAHGLSLSIGGVDVKEVLVTLVAEARASKGRIEALEKDAVARASKAAAQATRAEEALLRREINTAREIQAARSSVAALDARVQASLAAVDSESQRRCADVAARIDLAEEHLTESITATTTRLEANLSGQLESVEEALRAKTADLKQQVSSLRSETEAVVEETKLHTRATFELHEKSVGDAMREQAEERERRDREALLRYEECVGRLSHMGRRQKEVVALNLRSSLRSSVRRFYFSKLLRYVKIQRDLARRRRFVLQLGAKNARLDVKRCFNALMLWSRLSKKLKTKTRHFRALCTSTAKGSLLLRFSDWMRWRARLIAERQKLRERQQQVVKVCMQLVSHGTLRYWFAILAKNRVHKREKRVRDHLAQAFAKQTTESRKQSVFDTWKTYLQRHKVQLQKKALTTTFLSSTCNGLRQVYFDKLSGFLKHRRNMKKSNALMTTLRMLTQQGSKGEIFQRWKAVALRQRELAKKAAVAAAIANRMPDVCRRTYYAKWRVFAGGRKTTRARVLLDRSRRLELAMTARQKERKLLKACYRLWSEFQQKRSVERQGASTAENFSNLQQKTEALWYQLELHQKTVSNTNTCVQRLVDKIITVEDSVDRLDKTKASRRELQAYIDTNVVTAPVLLDDEVNPADDLVSSQTTIHGPADSHKHELSSLLPLGSADLHRGASSQFAASVHHRPTHRPPSPIYAIREASTHSRLPVHRHPSDPPQPTYPNLRSTYPPEHRR